MHMIKPTQTFCMSNVHNLCFITRVLDTHSSLKGKTRINHRCKETGVHLLLRIKVFIWFMIMLDKNIKLKYKTSLCLIFCVNSLSDGIMNQTGNSIISINMSIGKNRIWRTILDIDTISRLDFLLHPLFPLYMRLLISIFLFLLFSFGVHAIFFLYGREHT